MTSTMNKNPETASDGEQPDEAFDPTRRQARLVVSAEGTTHQLDALRAYIESVEQQIPGAAGEDGLTIKGLRMTVEGGEDPRYPFVVPPPPLSSLPASRPGLAE